MDSGYKIRNPDGLYSSGGTSPIFEKTGKFWKSRRAILLHFAQFLNYRITYRDCFIEEYVISFAREELVVEWDAPIEAEERRKCEQKRRAKAYKRLQIENKLSEIERLKSELAKDI